LHNDLLLREDLRGEIFLPLCKNSELSQKNQTLTLSSLSNSLLLHLTLSLSLHPPSRSQEGRRSRAPPAGRAQPRGGAARGRVGAAHGRGRAAPGLVGRGDPCLAKIQFLGGFEGDNQALILKSGSKGEKPQISENQFRLKVRFATLLILPPYESFYN